MKKYSIRFVLLLAGLGLFSACDDDGDGPDPCTSDFNQEAMFQNMADHLIIPAFEAFQSKLEVLQIAIQEFLTDPGITNLENVQNLFKDAYVSWQACAQYNFGPAEDVFLRSSINNFPLNIQALESNIESGSYDFDQPDRYDKGLPALDYLFFGLDEDPAVLIEFYTTSEDADQYRAYLNALIDDMLEKIDHTVAAWNGDYRVTFIANTGTAAGTSLSLIINHWNENYELIKREKLGVPSGVLTLGFTNPGKVEAFHSGISARLAKEALVAAKNLYTGGTEIGLDDYLTEINAKKDNSSLNSIILERFDAAIETVDGLSDPLSAVIEDDPLPVENAYNEVVRQIVNIKTDMPSVLCVSITYIDNPSDSD